MKRLLRRNLHIVALDGDDCIRCLCFCIPPNHLHLGFLGADGQTPSAEGVIHENDSCPQFGNTITDKWHVIGIQNNLCQPLVTAIVHEPSINLVHVLTPSFWNCGSSCRWLSAMLRIGTRSIQQHFGHRLDTNVTVNRSVANTQPYLKPLSVMAHGESNSALMIAEC